MAAVNKPSSLKLVGKVSVAEKETSLTKLKPTGQESQQRNVVAASGSSERIFTSSYQQSSHVYTAPIISSTSSSTPQVAVVPPTTISIPAVTQLAATSANSCNNNPIPPSVFAYRFVSPTNNKTPYYISSDIVLSGGIAQQTRRRIVHNEVERRRKDKINNWIVKLAGLIPDCSMGKQSKNIVLEKAVNYVTELKGKVEEFEELKKRNSEQAQKLSNLQTQLETTLNQNEDLRQLLKKFHISIPDFLAKPASVNVTVPVEIVHTVAPGSAPNTVTELQTVEASKTVASTSTQNQLGFSFHSVATLVNSSFQAGNTSTTDVCTSTPQNLSCVPTVPYVIVNQQPIGTATAVCYVSPVTVATTVVNNVDHNPSKSVVGINTAPFAITQPDVQEKSADQSLSGNGTRRICPSETKKAFSTSKRRQLSSPLSKNLKVVRNSSQEASRSANTAVSAPKFSATQPQVLCSSSSKKSPLSSTKPSKMPRMSTSQPSVTMDMPVSMDICEHEEILNIQNFTVSSLIPSIDDQSSTPTSLVSKQAFSSSQDDTQSSNTECGNKVSPLKITQSRQSPRMAYSIESLTGLTNGEQEASEGCTLMSSQKLTHPLAGQSRSGVTPVPQEAVHSTVLTSDTSYTTTQVHSALPNIQLHSALTKAQPQGTHSHCQPHVPLTQAQPQAPLTQTKSQKALLQSQQQVHLTRTQPRAHSTQTQPQVSFVQTQQQASHMKGQTEANHKHNQPQNQPESSQIQLLMQPQSASIQSQASVMQPQTQVAQTQTQIHKACTQVTTQVARTQMQPVASHIQSQYSQPVANHIQSQHSQPVASHIQSQHSQPGFSFSAEALLGNSDEILATTIPSINASLTETPSQTTNMFSVSSSGNFQDLSSRNNSQHSFSNFSAEALLSGNDITVEHTDSSAGQVTSTQDRQRNTSLQNHIFTDFSAESLIGPSDLSSGLSSYAIDNLIGRSGTSNYNTSAMITVNPNLIHTSVAETTSDHSVNPLRALAALPSLVEQKNPVSSSPNTALVAGASFSNTSNSSVLTGPSQSTALGYNLNQKSSSSKSSGQPVCNKPAHNAAPGSSSNVLKYSIDNIASSFFSPNNTGSLFLTGGSSSNTLPIMQSYSLDSSSAIPQFSFGLGGPFSPTRTVSGPTTGGFV